MNTKETIIVIVSYETIKYFFSIDHCQDHKLGKTYVPTTHYLPSEAVPRKGLEDGIIKNKEDLKTVFYYDMEEIRNPNQEKQA